MHRLYKSKPQLARDAKELMKGSRKRSARRSPTWRLHVSHLFPRHDAVARSAVLHVLQSCGKQSPRFAELPIHCHRSELRLQQQTRVRCAMRTFESWTGDDLLSLCLRSFFPSSRLFLAFLPRFSRRSRLRSSFLLLRWSLDAFARGVWLPSLSPPPPLLAHHAQLCTATSRAVAVTAPLQSPSCKHANILRKTARPTSVCCSAGSRAAARTSHRQLRCLRTRSARELSISAVLYPQQHPGGWGGGGGAKGESYEQAHTFC
jgi:hypothetical protein